MNQSTNLTEEKLYKSDWERRKRKELKELKEKLSKYITNKTLYNRELKQRIAWYSLNLIKKTPMTKKEIKNSSRYLEEFSKYNYDGLLDKVFTIASDINGPGMKISSNLFFQWKKMKELLEEYLK